MAFLDDLVTIRDQLASELKTEMARRAALVAAGKPAPTNYSLDGKSVQWDGYLSGMLARIKEMNELVNKTGADGGIPERIIANY